VAKRRGNKEGSIYFHKTSGKWCAQVSLQGRRLTKYFETQTKCREWIKEITQQIDQGLTFTAANLTVSRYLQKWIKIVETSLRPRTWIRYKQIARDHLVPMLGKIKLNDLRPDQIQSLYASKLEEGLSNRSVEFIHAVLRRSLNQALMWGLIARNPALATKPPKPKKKEMKYLTKEQVKILLSAVQGTRYSALYHLAVTTGLRKGELLGLKWDDVDWENKRLQVRRQLQRISHKGYEFSEPKSGRGKRVVALGDLTIEKFRKHKEIQKTDKEKVEKSWQEYNLIFPSTIGTPFGPRNLNRHFSELLGKTNLPKIRFHDLRHTAATLMFSQGVHPKVVQERLGHSSISLTLDTYSHVIPSIQSQAADIIDAELQ